MESVQEVIFQTFDEVFDAVKNGMKLFEKEKSCQIQGFVLDKKFKTMLNEFGSAKEIESFIVRAEKEKMLYVGHPSFGTEYQSENGFCHYFSFVTTNATILVLSYNPKSKKIQELFYRTFDFHVPQFCERLVMINYFSNIVSIVNVNNRYAQPEELIKIESILESTIIKILEYIKNYKTK